MWWNYLSIPKRQRLHRWKFEMDTWFHPTLYDRWIYLSMLGLKLIHVNPWHAMQLSSSPRFQILRPRQNDKPSHWADGIFNSFSSIKNLFIWIGIQFWLEFNSDLFPRIQLTTSQHWHRFCIGTEQAIGHYLNQFWSYILTHIYVTRSQFTLVIEYSLWNMITDGLGLCLYINVIRGPFY